MQTAVRDKHHSVACLNLSHGRTDKRAQQLVTRRKLRRERITPGQNQSVVLVHSRVNFGCRRQSMRDKPRAGQHPEIRLFFADPVGEDQAFARRAMSRAPACVSDDDPGTAATPARSASKRPRLDWQQRRLLLHSIPHQESDVSIVEANQTREPRELVTWFGQSACCRSISVRVRSNCAIALDRRPDST